MSDCTLRPIKPSEAAPFPLDRVLIGAGANVWWRSLKRRLFGWKKYPGDAAAICRAVVEDCWNGNYFAGSAGHFGQFWTRDLAMCTPALVRLGHRKRVLQSWAWGLERFEDAGRITTTIFNGKHPRDVYAYACDSLPMLLHGLDEAHAWHLIEKHHALISREVEQYVARVYDPETGLARTDGYFSAPRDCMTGRSTVFTNTMIALLGQMLERYPSLPQLLRGVDIGARLVETHWTGESFKDALDNDLPSGDANVWPFHFGIFGPFDQAMRTSAFATLDRLGFTDPLPLRYFQERLPKRELVFPRICTPNYQGDTSWMQLGAVYLAQLRRLDPIAFTNKRVMVEAFIERDRNFMEVYRSDGKPYRGRATTYYCDEGMLWAAMFLDLL